MKALKRAPANPANAQARPWHAAGDNVTMGACVERRAPANPSLRAMTPTTRQAICDPIRSPIGNHHRRDGGSVPPALPLSDRTSCSALGGRRGATIVAKNAITTPCAIDP